MADLILTVPDAQFQMFVDAFASEFASQLQPGETSVGLTKRMIGAFIINRVRVARAKAAALTAYNTATATVDGAATVAVAVRATTGGALDTPLIVGKGGIAANP